MSEAEGARALRNPAGAAEDGGAPRVDTTALRLFVAIELPPEWRAALARIQQRQEQSSPGYFRWVGSELYHLTLVFLGNQPAGRLPELVEAIGRAAAGVAPFALRLGKLGSFGRPRAPRVVWVEAVQPDGRLQQMRRALERELREAGITFDEKPLRPHITLGRARRDASGSPRLVGARLQLPAREVDRLVLFESQLGPSGPNYTAQAVAPLVGRQ